jgi:hypothetical protein
LTPILQKWNKNSNIETKKVLTFRFGGRSDRQRERCTDGDSPFGSFVFSLPREASGKAAAFVAAHKRCGVA